MEKIPTAEEFYSQCRREWDVNGDNPLPNSNRYAIEFAKLHVEAALKAAAENVSLGGLSVGRGPIKNSILSAYSLENIK